MLHVFSSYSWYPSGELNEFMCVWCVLWCVCGVFCGDVFCGDVFCGVFCSVFCGLGEGRLC